MRLRRKNTPLGKRSFGALRVPNDLMSSGLKQCCRKEPPIDNSRKKRFKARNDMLKRGLGVQAADVLRNDILSGVLQPGQQITEEGLAKQLGVSRSTIRSSIQQLVHEGIVHYEPYKGNYVRPLNADDAWEIYTLRNVLESLASRLAAKSIAEDGKAQLENALNRLRSAIASGEQRAIVDADFALHMIIVQLSTHKLLLAQYKQLENLTRLYMNTLSGYRANLDELLEEHVTLVAAILSGDEAGAEKIASEHNVMDGRFLQKQLSKMNMS